MKIHHFAERLYAPKNRSTVRRAFAIGSLWLYTAASALLMLVPLETLARVGGGQSYGGKGGGGGGSDDGGAIIAIVRILIYLTIEYPAIGIPVDIVVVGFVVYRFAR